VAVVAAFNSLAQLREPAVLVGVVMVQIRAQMVAQEQLTLVAVVAVAVMQVAQAAPVS